MMPAFGPFASVDMPALTSLLWLAIYAVVPGVPYGLAFGLLVRLWASVTAANEPDDLDRATYAVSQSAGINALVACLGCTASVFAVSALGGSAPLLECFARACPFVVPAAFFSMLALERARNKMHDDDARCTLPNDGTAQEKRVLRTALLFMVALWAIPLSFELARVLLS